MRSSKDQLSMCQSPQRGKRRAWEREADKERVAEFYAVNTLFHMYIISVYRHTRGPTRYRNHELVVANLIRRKVSSSSSSCPHARNHGTLSHCQQIKQTLPLGEPTRELERERERTWVILSSLFPGKWKTKMMTTTTK